MATKAELMGSGMPAGLANKLGQDAVVHLTPGADSQGGTLITATQTILDSASAGSVTLPSAHAKSPHVIMNNSGANQKIYPATGESINAGSANSAFTLNSGKSAICVASNNFWMIINGA